MKTGTQAYNIDRLMKAVWENGKPLMWMEKQAEKYGVYAHIKGNHFHYEHLYELHHAKDPEAFRAELQEKLDKYETLEKRFASTQMTRKITLAYRQGFDGKANWLVTFSMRVLIK